MDTKDQFEINIRCKEVPMFKLKVTSSTEIKKLKHHIETITGISSIHQKLLLRGRVLRDTKQVKDYKIKNNSTVMLVSSQKKISTGPTVPGVGSSRAFGGMDPKMIKQAMNNPMFKQMLSNPELMKQMMLMNPQLKEVVEKNPEVGEILSDPDMMKKAMEISSNPEMMDEMLKSQDRAMNNITSLPGGFDALVRMNNNIIDPLHRATREIARDGVNDARNQMGNGQGDKEYVPKQSNQVNTESMPNPWAPRRSNTNSNTNRNRNPFNLGQFGSNTTTNTNSNKSNTTTKQPTSTTNKPTTSSTNTTSNTTNPTTTNTNTPTGFPFNFGQSGTQQTGTQQNNPFGNMMNMMGNMGNMGNMMGNNPLGQMVNDPNFQNMAKTFSQSPQYQQMLDGMMDNPDFFKTMLQMNPMVSQNPMMRQMLDNPDFLNMMMNMTKSMREQKKKDDEKKKKDEEKK